LKPSTRPSPARAAPLLIALAILVAGCATGSAAATESSARSAAVLTGEVDRFVDGDTLLVYVDGGDREYVRLVGIDTPEDVKEDSPVECGSRQAARSMAQLAPEGARVVLRIDSVAGERDRFGRLLAHAFVGGRQLEVVQLRRGWAEIYRYRDQRFEGLERFEAAEAAAERADRGVWGACGGDFHSSR
jgi:micrococcal nuclease